MSQITFSPKQIENINQDISNITFEMNEGTPRSGKTTSDIFKMAAFYIKSPDKNHLVSAYNQEQAFRMFMDGDGFGLMHIFKGCSEVRHDDHGDHLLINAPNGEKKIYYKGGGKVNSVGAITGMSLGSVTFLEFNLLHKEFIKEAFRRTFAAGWRYHLGEQNPPSPNHPNLEELKRFEKASKYKFRHWNPNDNPILTEKRKQELFNELSASEYLLDRDWYGKRSMPEGIIYSVFNQSNHMKKSIQGEIVEVFFTADGGQGDATTCACNVVTVNNGEYKLYRIANYYHSGTETGQVKAMSKYASEIKRFSQWCYETFDLPKYDYFFVDPACKSLREELHLLDIQTTGADNNSKDNVTSNGTKIEVGIERMQNALQKGVFFLLDLENKDPLTKRTYGHYYFIKEIGMYVRGNNGLPVDKDNHALDECRYAINYFTRKYLL